MKLHPDLAATKADPFHFEPKTLLSTFLSGERDPTARRDHTVPGKLLGPMERTDRQPGGSGIAGSGRDLAVGHHLPPRYPGDEMTDPQEGGHRSAR